MASKYIQKFPIPGQFPDILHDFVREVLRDQPENIYEYGAAYFTALDEVSFHSWGGDVRIEEASRCQGRVFSAPHCRLCLLNL